MLALCMGLLGGLYGVQSPRAAAEDLPPRLTDQAFWQIVSGFSEPGGYFRSDNFISNEATFQHVIPELKEKTAPGGVYLGVGPDQNFTYITALRPKLAFIIDIRRQNMLLHLLDKALIEISPDRAAFLSRLFCRERPAGLGATSTPQALFKAFSAVAPSRPLFLKNLETVVKRLTVQHGFSLTTDDIGTIEYVYDAFFNAGPDLQYSFPRQEAWRRFPTYADLMVETDERGEPHGYLATEEYYRILRDLERSNRIIPLVGDFAGDKAIRSVGRYLKEHGATVTAFYTSNVEMYLFQSEAWRRFFANAATLPLDGNSTFIRAYFSNLGFVDQASGASVRSTTLLDPITGLLRAVSEGRIQTYYDVVVRSR